MRILVTPTSLQPESGSPALELLKEYADEIVCNDKKRPLTEEELIPLLAGCDGYIAGLDQITEKVINSTDRLKVISRYGAGYDRVDLKAAAEKGIIVTNTPGANAEAVGELTWALILAAARKIPYLHASTKDGGWERSSGLELKGKTLGIMGLGAIGKVTARCAAGFEMKVIAYDPYINEAYCEEKGIRAASFEEVLEKADVITLHLPLLESTRHLIDAEAISRMKKGVILINASRGGIIDEDAAYEGLISGRIGGMGLDAFETEPPVNSRLLQLNNVVATPHTGAHTAEAAMNMAFMAVENAIAVLSGKPCSYVVKR